MRQKSVFVFLLLAACAQACLCVRAGQARTRYGAFPSTTTWFLSAGIWPDNLNAPKPHTAHRLNSRVHIVKDAGHRIEFQPVDEQVRDDGWFAQIVKVSCIFIFTPPAFHVS